MVSTHTTSFNSLLGFSSFESPDTSPEGVVRDKNGLSIPYWDFLVLNLSVIGGASKHGNLLSIPYWDFLVLNLAIIAMKIA